MNLTKTFIFSFACLLACNPTFATAEKVYKWTDAKGQTHYSQHPPFNTETETIKPQTGHSDPVEYKAAIDAQDKTVSKAENNVAQPKDKERCESARQVAETLKIHTRIRVKGDDGEFHYLTPDEHQQKVDEANKAIQESCN